MNLKPQEMDKVMCKFKKALNIEETENTNVYISPSEIKKIKTEIKRLKFIAREFRGDKEGFNAKEMLVKLQNKIS